MKILNYLTAFKLKVNSAITAMLPDKKTLKNQCFFNILRCTRWGGGMHIWGAGLLTMFSKICVAVYTPIPGS